MNTIEQAREVSNGLRHGYPSILRIKAADTLDALIAELASIKQQEPVAWLHDEPGRVDCIHKDVKELWLRVGQPSGFYREKVPCKVEHYTTPLYLAAGAQPVPPGYQLVPIEPTHEMAMSWLAASHMAMSTFTQRYKAMLAAAPVQAGAQAYKYSTPHLSVGDSSFENWFSEYNPAQRGTKQQMRDAYAAGMGDPLAAPADHIADAGKKVQAADKIPQNCGTGHCSCIKCVKPVVNGSLTTQTTCQWTPMDAEYTPDTWESACGEAWSFVEGGPKENNYRFCHGCGKPVEVVE